MAVSNEFVALVVAMGMMFWLMHDKTRWKRLMGSAGLITGAITLVVIGDNIPMYFLSGVGIIFGGLQLLEDAVALTK